MSTRLTLRNFVVILCVAFAGLLAFSADAQDNGSIAASEPENVKFSVRTKTGATIFRVGEVIPLELSFTSSSEKTYQLNMATYDRSGRMSYEKFLVEPESGWRDPVQGYFSAFLGFIGGGLRTSMDLSDKPSVIPLQLNEWVQFEITGEYRLRVTSSRVSSIQQQNAIGNEQAVTSNELKLTIIPATKEWQEQTLHAAAQTIDRSAPSSPSGAQPQPSEVVQAAVKTLRYLGTAEAAHEMARRLKDDGNAHDFSFGLIGSPERDAALKAMEERLSDPDAPITDNFVTTMSVLSIGPDLAQDAKPKAREQAAEQIRTRLWEVIPKKQGMAKSISLMTAAFSGTNEKLSDGAIQELAANFDGLPTQKQQELIEYRWDAIKSPAFLPVLRKYARQYQDFPMLTESNAYTSIHLSGAALQHWYELAPEEARAAMIEEMLRPKPRFDARTLGLLPDKALPEVEQTLVERLRSSDNFQISGNLASLLERYGTKAVLPQMLSILDENVGKWACAIQTPALAFVLRIDPASARSRVEEAMAARGPGFTGCNHSLLVEVGKLHFDPLLEEIADRSLWDTDPMVAENAADFLGQFGSAAAEALLWERLEQWSDEWHGREAELRGVPGEINPNQWQSGLGVNLAISLSRGQAWLADSAKLRRIAQLSVVTHEQEQLERMAEVWQGTWSITCFWAGPAVPKRCAVLQYGDLSFERLKEKLAQFPSGSEFRWQETVQPRSPGDDNLYEDLAKFLAEHGMSLSKAN